jgi:hypothetical protein
MQERNTRYAVEVKGPDGRDYGTIYIGIAHPENIGANRPKVMEAFTGDLNEGLTAVIRETDEREFKEAAEREEARK